MANRSVTGVQIRSGETLKGNSTFNDLSGNPVYYSRGSLVRLHDAGLGLLTVVGVMLTGDHSATQPNWEVALEGEYEVAKATGAGAAIVGRPLYLDPNTGKATVTPYFPGKIGVVARQALDADNTYLLSLDGDSVVGRPVLKGVAVFDATGGVAVGTVPLIDGDRIPSGYRILYAWVDVLTTFTSGDDSATIQLKIHGGATIKAALAISDASNYWDAGLGKATVAVNTIASALAAPTGEATVDAVVAVQALTAGKLYVHWIAIPTGA